MKLYIPFNLLVDTDYGIIRLVEKLYDIPEYSVDKVKSFLLTRENEDPIIEYCNLREIDYEEDIINYNHIIENEYKKILPLSKLTDIVSFVINTYKLGLSNELEITIGCNYDFEIEHLQKRLSKLNYTLDIVLNSDIKMDSFDYIFTKVLDKHYVNYLETNNIRGKRLYVANYAFNAVVDEEKQSYVIDPTLHLHLESMGIVVNTVTIYNKK